MQKNNSIKIGFFGGPEISLITLNALYNASYTISCIVTSPDRPKGRNLIMTPPPAKVWAEEHDIPVLQPEKLRDSTFIESLKKYNCDVFVVMAYGKIIPDEILNIPRCKSLNIHPSLLPKYRGSCPLESTILNDDSNTGVTIIRMDNEMDHGPIIAQQQVQVSPWPKFTDELGEKLVSIGADLLISILPDWIAGKIQEIPQDHSIATYTTKIKKEDGLIDPDGNPYKNYLKYMAHRGWPSVFFFNGTTRVKITDASFVDGKFVINKVIPEGKSEMLYTDFL